MEFSPEVKRWIIIVALATAVFPISRLPLGFAAMVFVVFLSGAMMLGMMLGVNF